jgi:sugar phosphate permease
MRRAENIATGEVGSGPRHGRWIMLALGMAAQGAAAALHQGLPVLGPVLQEHLDLSLGETGILLASVPAGFVLTLYAWGLLADRVGERVVIALGLCAGGAAAVGATFAQGFAPACAAFLTAGLLAASANAASGRAVMGWFGRAERGTALGLRQMSTPLGAALAAAALPSLAAIGGLDAALYALGAAMMGAGILAGIWLRSPALKQPAAATVKGREGHAAGALHDHRIWRLALGSAPLAAVQLTLVSFFVLFLHERIGLSTAAAAAALVAAQLLGAIGRVAAGRWSDLLGRRLGPLRTIALACAALPLFCASATLGPELLAAFALVLTTTVAMSWNGLSFAAVGEIAGLRRAGAAMGLQNTALYVAGATVPAAFGFVVEVLGWAGALATLSILALAGWSILWGLDEPSEGDDVGIVKRKTQ